MATSGVKPPKGQPVLKPSQDDMENSLQDLFLDYLNKAREVAGLTHNDEHAIDSEVSLHMHSMIHEYDKYRNRKE